MGTGGASRGGATTARPNRSSGVTIRPADRPLSAAARELSSTDVVDVLAMSPATDGTRRWALLHRDEHAEAWAIAWPPGSGLSLHDHDGSRCGMYVVHGALRERYRSGDGLVVRWWQRSGCYELPSDHTHEVVNVGDDEAVSVHVYSPPVGEAGIRDAASIGLFLTDAERAGPERSAPG